MSTLIKIGKRNIGPSEPCFIVAEISGNHNGKYTNAVKLIKAAKKAGADAVKLQTYTADTITIDSNRKWFQVGRKVGSKNSPADWKGKTLYQLFQTAYTPWEWQPKLKKIAEKLELVFFSSVFDPTSVDFLEKLKVPCYKVASYEITDIPLLKKVARTRKPVIMSAGLASTYEDIKLAVDTLRKNGGKDVAVLHCVTAYSAKPKPENANLKTIQDFKDKLGVISGFSDNNAGIEIPVAAVIGGASIVEKHLTLSRSDGGPDARFSLEPSEFKEMVAQIRKAEQLLGKPSYGPTNKTEKDYQRSRRSIFVVQDIKRGERFSESNIHSIRPGFGLHPKLLDKILGKKAARNIKRGTPLSENLIDLA